MFDMMCKYSMEIGKVRKKFWNESYISRKDNTNHYSILTNVKLSQETMKFREGKVRLCKNGLAKIGFANKELYALDCTVLSWLLNKHLLFVFWGVK